MLGRTPLMRIGFAPKQLRVYRSGDAVRSRKLHPLEIFSGTGQFVGFGWHEKAARPYIWPQCSPLDVSADSDTIPLVTRAQLDRFTTELFKIVPRRLLPTKQGRPGPPANDRRAVNDADHAVWQLETRRFHGAQRSHRRLPERYSVDRSRISCGTRHSRRVRVGII